MSGQSKELSGHYNQLSKRTALTVLGSAVIGGAVSVGAGLGQGWLLRPQDRDRGRLVIPEQRQQDLIQTLLKDREKNGIPGAEFYPQTPDMFDRDSFSFLLSEGKFRPEESEVAKSKAAVSKRTGFMFKTGNIGELVYFNSRFNLGDGKVIPQQDKNNEQVFTNSEFMGILPPGSINTSQVIFTNFHRYEKLREDYGSVVALITAEIPEERFVFSYLRQEENKVWVRVNAAAFKIIVDSIDSEGNSIKGGSIEHVLVNYSSFDPLKKFPLAASQTPTYDSFAVLVTDKKGRPILGGVKEMRLWGGLRNFNKVKPLPVR